MIASYVNNITHCAYLSHNIIFLCNNILEYNKDIIVPENKKDS